MMGPVAQIVTDNRQEISRLCAELSVRELRLFGSAVTDGFDPSRSDIDVLADFFDPEAPGIADRFMAHALGWESIFQRLVDLVARQALKTPFFAKLSGKTASRCMPPEALKLPVLSLQVEALMT